MQKLSVQRKPRVFDCVTFFNELDILELRLAELNDLVDIFVIAEGTRTFRGDLKPLIFEKNAYRFDRYLPKIRYLIVDDLPVHARSAWEREYWSRRALMRGLEDSLPEDVVIVSDVDEIPRPERLGNWINNSALDHSLVIMESEAFLYYLNVRPIGRRLSTVQAPRMLRRKFLRDAQKLRGFRSQVSKKRSLGVVEDIILRARALATFGAPIKVVIDHDAAWHFSFIGSPDIIRYKLLSYSHAERTDPGTVDEQNIARRIREGSWLFDDTIRLETIPIGRTFPASVRENCERWAPLVRPAAAQ